MAWQDENHPFNEMFKRFGESLKLPPVDINAVMEAQRKNLEALEQSARAAGAGAASLMNRQREAIESGLRDATEMAQSLRTPGAPGEMLGKQADFARRSFEAAVKNAGDMAEIVRQSGTESVEILRKRVRESMEETLKGFGTRS